MSTSPKNKKGLIVSVALSASIIFTMAHFSNCGNIEGAGSSNTQIDPAELENMQQAIAKKQQTLLIQAQENAPSDIANDGNDYTICDDQLARGVVYGDCVALVDFYHATDGDNWSNNTNWLTETPVEQWYGVDYFATWGGSVKQGFYAPSGQPSAGVENFRVKSLLSINNNLTGALPDSIGNLTEMKHFYVRSADFSGTTIPDSIGNLTNLMKLGFNNTQLTGNIPDTVANMQLLREIIFGYNQLTGSIPVALTQLPSLRYLILHGNQFTGEIPDTIGNLQSLRTLSLGNNNFTGEIPDSVGTPTNLNNVFLSHNALTGSIPTSLGNLDLTWFQVANNQLTGEIPDFVGQDGLYVLSLADNYLTGDFTSTQVSPSVFYIFLKGNCLNDPSNETLMTLNQSPLLEVFNFLPQGTTEYCAGAPGIEAIHANLNGDDNINEADLSLFVSQFDTRGPEADLNDDGIVNAMDFMIFLQGYKNTSRGMGDYDKINQATQKLHTRSHGIPTLGKNGEREIPQNFIKLYPMAINAPTVEEVLIEVGPDMNEAIEGTPVWAEHTEVVDSIEGDIDQNGHVGPSDYRTLLSQYGMKSKDLSADLNDDGVVDRSDFDVMLANYGRSAIR